MEAMDQELLSADILPLSFHKDIAVFRNNLLNKLKMRLNNEYSTTLKNKTDALTLIIDSEIGELNEKLNMTTDLNYMMFHKVNNIVKLQNLSNMIMLNINKIKEDIKNK